ncbi:Chromatin associated protein [Mycena sanguinolenta]|uniref:Chromatin associated protein n=1 Tax=Mycena sanguinolenta TaxID=230812 RepID=A0A8H6Z5H1_9AGAR|nr:Chromatin associated protein [Mycena sanguinolenta]
MAPRLWESCLLIRGETHDIACHFTSKDYGRRVDPSEAILAATRTAVADLLEQNRDPVKELHAWSLRPTAAAPESSRLQDALELIKQEFDSLTNELSVSRAQREKYEATISAQVDELNNIRQALYDLDQKHTKIRQQYEEELRSLRADLKQASRAPQPSVFSGVEPYYRDRDDRERTVIPRDRERPISSPHPRERDRFLDDQSRDTKRSKESSVGSTPVLPQPPSAAPNLAPTPRLPQRGITASANDFLADAIDPSVVPAQFKKEGSDWFVLYNPTIPRTLDVSLVHTFMHETVVCCVQFSTDGKWLATGCNKTAQIFDVLTGQKLCVLSDDSSGETGDLYIRSVRFSPDGKFLATGAEDKRIRVWDISKRAIRAVFEGHQQEIYSLDFSTDGRLMVSGSGDRTVRVWHLEDGSVRVFAATPEADPATSSGPANADAGVTSVAISPDGALVAAGCVDAVVRIWNVPSGVLVEQLRGHQDSVYSVVFTHDGYGLVSGSLDNTLKYWNLRGSKARKEGGKPTQCMTTFLGHKDYVLSVGVSRDSQWFVSGSKDRGIQFWDQTGVVQCMLQGHKNSVISISLGPTDMLASGSGDNLARIWSYNKVA